MNKEELEKATGKELIEERDYCGVDGYRGDYLDEVNAEMFKRFNRLAELEKENAELKDKLEILIAVGNTCTKGLNKQLTKAKEIMREMLRILPKENIEGVYEITEEAEQFLEEERINEEESYLCFRENNWNKRLC